MYSIMRIKKIKSIGALVASANHNHRLTYVPNSNQNGKVLCLVGTSKIDIDFNERVSSANAKPAKNSVIAAEVLLSASPKFFLENKNQLKPWVEENIAFIKEIFGEKNLINAVLHLDESTPHIHATVIPLKLHESGRFAGKYRFSAKSWLGGAEKLRALQDHYADKMSIFELERGIRGSKATHQEVKKWYGAIKLLEKIKIQEAKLNRLLDLIIFKSRNLPGEIRDGIQRQGVAVLKGFAGAKKRTSQSRGGRGPGVN